MVSLLDLTNHTRSAWASGMKAWHPVVLGGWPEAQSSVFHKPKKNKEVDLGWGRAEKRGSEADQVCLEEAPVQWGTEARGGSGSSQRSRLIENKQCPSGALPVQISPPLKKKGLLPGTVCPASLQHSHTKQVKIPSLSLNLL